MMERIEWLKVAIILALAAPGCSVYRIADNDGGVRGIPFYARAAECRQSSVYQEDVRRVTLSTIGITPGVAGAAATERVLQTRSKLVRGSTIESAADLRRSVEQLSQYSEITPLFAAFDELAHHRATEWRSDSVLAHVSNANSSVSFVDYSRPLYFNGTRPGIGSASVSMELGPDGTLAKASAEIEDRTLETLLALVPLSELLSSKFIPAEVDPFIDLGEPQMYRAELKVDALPVLHTLSRTTQLKQPCPHVDRILPTDSVGVTYLRTATGTPSPKAETPPNAVSITGQLILPAPKQ